MGVPISNVTRRVVFAASGTGPYAFTFEILANTDIAVYKDDTLLTLTTDYTVTINTNGTGSVTLTASPTGADQIAIVGNRTIARTTDFVTGGDFFANTINSELDQQTIFAQQNAESIDRSLKAPQTDSTSINMTLPRASVRAGKYLSFDSTGNPVAAEGRTEVAEVYAIRDEVQAVAAIDSDVVTVAGAVTNVGTVAGSIASVNAVGANIANVVAAGSNETNINTVAGQITPTNRISTVAGISSNITTVAGISSNVTSVAGNSTNINTVAGQISPTNNVSTVAGVAASVATVAGISANVTTVAGVSSNVTTVATNIANVNATGGSITSVNTVAGSIANVNTNATNIANINANAANITAIQNASSNATSAAASATTATTQAAAAAASAAAASAVVLSNEPVRPALRPSLLLDFANTKQLDPRITFTRASTATFYDGQTVAKAEENLLLYSQDMSNAAAWGADNVGTGTSPTNTSNAGTAPDGTTTASRWVLQLNGGTTTSDRAMVRQVFTPVNALDYTYSVWIRSYDGTSTYNAQIVGANGAGSAVSITGTWTRFTVTATGAGAITAFGVRLRGGQSPTNSNSADILVWGAQLEQRSAVTAYTATTASKITNYIPALQTAASGVARFDNNPTTQESLGLLIEEARTNLLTYSEQFDNAAWTKTRSSITANTIVAPDGTLTGDKIVEDTTASNTHQIVQQTTTSAGAVTATFYVKAAERSYCQIRFQEGGSFLSRAEFNLATGQAIAVAGSLPTITNVGNGWYRISLTATSAGSATFQSQFWIYQNTTTTNYTGDGYSGIYIWGAQLEAGSFATSYIPTTSAQVTRAADAASMTGTNFSSWYRADEGTLYAESKTNNSAAVSSAVASLFANSSNYQRIRHVGAMIDVTAVSSGTTTVDTDGIAVTVGTFGKTALGFKVNDYSQYTNSSSGGTNNSAALPIGVNVLNIGSTDGSANPLNGTIKKIAYYPQRVTNAQLQAITTV